MQAIINGGILFWIILILIIFSIGIFLDRLLRLRKIAIDPQDFLQGIFIVLNKKQYREALSLCDETPGPLAALMERALEHRDCDEAHLREILTVTAHAELSRLERRSMLLSLFAQILPLLGLIGTFIGGAAALSAVNFKAPLVIPGEIVIAASGALATTILSLIGALFCYVAHHILVLKTDALCLNMDIGMALILDYFSRELEL
jgi:biopolymer transport protein ExbB